MDWQRDRFRRHRAIAWLVIAIALAALPLTPSWAGGSSCGNGVTEAGEDCDGLPCCTASCTFAPFGTPCGIACVDSICALGAASCSVCSGESTVCMPYDLLCDDGNACTQDVCTGSSCSHSIAQDGTSCSDGQICSGAQTCQAGKCTAEPFPVFTCTLPPSSMVSWWPGDGTADDIEGGNTGSLNGAGFAAGQVAQAFSLEGNGFVGVGNPVSLQLGSSDLTVDAWVYFNDLTGDMHIVRKMDDSNVDGWMLLKQTDNRFWFCLGGGNAGNGCSPSQPTTIRSTTTAQTGVWYHVAATKSADGIAIFVNGQPEDSKPLPAFQDTDVTGMSLGLALGGLLDEVEIFNRALAQSEIAAIAGACSAGKCKDCDGDASCEDGYPCTDDACDAQSGQCQHTPHDCSDGDACTEDACAAVLQGEDVCTHTPVLCEDQDPCSVDACDPKLGCTHHPKSCDDKDACTVDRCDPQSDVDGGCVHEPVECFDEILCTSDGCDPSTGCIFQPISCEDENVCTDDACNPSTGSCEHVNNTNPCGGNNPTFGEQGEGCFTGSVCSEGACVEVSPLCPLATILADTTIREAHPALNYGRSIELEADDPPYENRTLIRFRVTGARGQHITKATLRLFSMRNSASGGRVRVSTCGWSETGVTWATKPIFSTVLDTAGPLVAGQRVAFDITPLVAAGGDETYCVGIDNILDDENYSSREAPAGRPDVVIETDCPCEPVRGEVTADATVVNTSPGKNFGLDSTIGVDASPIKRTFLRVEVSGVEGRTVKSARLRLQVAKVSGSDSDKGGTIRLVPSSQCGWTETGITYNNRPTSAGSSLSSVGAVKAGQIVELDLKSTIPGDGSYCYRIESSSSNGADYNSLQGFGLRPELVLVVTP